MKVLVLAAGFGVRLREVIHGQPKHMASVNGRPFLRHLAELLRRRGVKEIIFSVGYLPQPIKDEFAGYQFSEDDRPMGTGGSLKNAQKFFRTDFLLINGDTYLDINYQKLMSKHKESGAILTIVQKDGINAGAYAVSPKIFPLIPEGTKISLEEETIPHLKACGQINLFPIKASFIDIGSPEGYIEAIKKLK
jgi:NDP-sugar pyrophosphorylase family protein